MRFNTIAGTLLVSKSNVGLDIRCCYDTAAYFSDKGRIPMSQTLPKLFVLDTNVVLHDAGCIDNFEENDIATTVLKELDKFKRGVRTSTFNRANSCNLLDELTGPLLSEEGASRGDNLGNIRVVIGGPLDQQIYTAFLEDSPDRQTEGLWHPA
jgi:PhoH-like ATPase